MEPPLETSSDWARPGARPAALNYQATAADQNDEFLGWFLAVTRGGGTNTPQRLAGTGAIARLSSRLPALPQAELVQRAVAEWAALDPQLSGWLAAGMPIGRALAHWGMTHVQARQLPLAVSAFRAAAALAPMDPGAWANYGVALDMTRSLPDASASLERSLFLSPRQPAIWLQLGLVRKKSGERAGAEAAYRTALEQEPANAVAWQCLGLLKEEQADFPGAIDCYAACIERGGGGPAISANLGKLCYRLGRFVEAQQAYAEAVRGEPGNAGFQLMFRKLTFIRTVLEGGAVETAIAGFRASHPEWNEAAQKEFREVFDLAFGALTGFGHGEAARMVGRKHVELWPGVATMQYLLEALEGRPADRSPTAYIVEHFDRFAESFDSQLVGTLGYDLPGKIGGVVKQLLGGSRIEQTLDAGCGTGLCGPLLRPFTDRLTGVDLSPRMLAQAEKRWAYDSLVCDDLLGFLGRSVPAYDLIVAADVLIYFGDLGVVLRNAARATRPGGWLIFSTETNTGPGYRLQPMGRFVHATDYVTQAAGPDFVLHSCTQTTLRQEGTSRVPGQLFVFRRR
ncbi:MAG: methyltransferase [Opitutales bacterium]